MREVGADGGQRVLEIGEDLLRLGAEVAGRADNLVVEIKPELPRDIDDPSGRGGLDHMGIAGRLRDRCGVVKAMNGHCGAPLVGFES